jgi:hypothetical protein
MNSILQKPAFEKGSIGMDVRETQAMQGTGNLSNLMDAPYSG